MAEETLQEEVIEEQPEQPEQEVQEEAPQEEPEVEPSQPTEEQEEPESPPAEEEPKPSRRESLRIQKLLSQLKENPLPLKTERKIEGGLDYGQALDADPEVIARLEADRRAVADAQYNRGLEQARSIQFHTRLEIDAPKVESKYPQLNRESDQFDPVIADALNGHYLHLVGYDSKTDTVQNPGLRYAEFVEAQYELAKALATEQVSRTSKNIAKQAATTGLRPDGSQAKRLNLNKAPEEMTDEELKAVIGASLPK
jgi:hypothetical protein